MKQSQTDDQPLDIKAMLAQMSAAAREHLIVYGLSERPDTSGRLPAKRVCTKEFGDV